MRLFRLIDHAGWVQTRGLAIGDLRLRVSRVHGGELAFAIWFRLTPIVIMRVIPSKRWKVSVDVR
jgi:hypothetical protein